MKTLRIALLAGEASGDILGSRLMAELKQRINLPIQFEGIGGPLMLAEGLDSSYPMERLSVMGLVEVLGRLPELLKLRRYLIQRWQKFPPDLFIGIDAPDFNLKIEQALKAQGTKTVHYVSPSVWAWREHRVKQIKQAADVVLCLLPFEPAFYQKHRVKAVFVGHPLADEIPLQQDPIPARLALGLRPKLPVLALLPGSRAGEISRLAPVFIETARRCKEAMPQLQLVCPMVNAERRAQFLSLWHNTAPDLPITLVAGQSREVMAAADLLLMASGTATLEGTLVKRPMLVAYRFNQLTWALVKRLVKVPFAALPNLLANKLLVPEFLQERANADLLAPACLELLQDVGAQQRMQHEFELLHRQLQVNSSQIAVDALLPLLGNKLQPAEKPAMAAAQAV